MDFFSSRTGTGVLDGVGGTGMRSGHSGSEATGRMDTLSFDLRSEILTEVVGAAAINVSSEST